MRYPTLMVAALLGGCADGTAAPALINLAQPTRIEALTADAASQLTLTASAGFKGATPVTLSVHDLLVRLHTGDTPALEALEIPLADVDLGASYFPPSGIQLRGLKLHVDGAVRAEVMHAQADAAEVRARAPLTLDWALLLPNGNLYPLNPARTEPLDLDVQITDGATPTVTVAARCDGVCWSVPGVAELRDGALYLEAPAAISPL